MRLEIERNPQHQIISQGNAGRGDVHEWHSQGGAEGEVLEGYVQFAEQERELVRELINRRVHRQCRHVASFGAIVKYDRML